MFRMRSRVLLSLLFIIVCGASRGRAVASEASLEIYFIDVLGGAATLIVTPDRESVLIDSGWPGNADRDPKRIVHVIKDVAGLDHLDHLVTTHWHMDHYGGVEGLVKLIRVDQFWDRGLPSLEREDGDAAAFPDGPKRDDPLGIAYRKASEGKRKMLKAGSKIPLRGEIEAIVLASGTEIIGSNGAENLACAAAPVDLASDRSDNARSLALRFRVKSFDFLDCGDLTWNIEKQLVCPTDKIGPIDVYQVTHHGMSISNHPLLVRTVAPTVTVMNNGPNKGGDPAAVKLLRSIPSIQASYQLHKNAKTTTEENTDAALIANKNPAGGQFIRVKVTPDGTRFSVQIGEDGALREFATK